MCCRRNAGRASPSALFTEDFEVGLGLRRRVVFADHDPAGLEQGQEAADENDRTALGLRALVVSPRS